MTISELDKADKNWIVRYNDYVPTLVGRREAICTLGNGYFASRASAPESSANTIHFPGTYIAGLYNRLRSEVDGHTLEHEDLVNAPNWLSLSFKIEDEPWFELENVQIISYQQSLHLQEGILYRQIHFKDQKGRETSLFEKRFIHMRHYHLAGLESKIIAHNWSGKISIRWALDGKVINATGIYTSTIEDKKHLEPIESSIDNDMLYLKMRTNQSLVEIAEASRVDLLHSNKLVSTKRKNIIEKDYVAQEIQLDIVQNDQITIQKTVSLFTSRDLAISEAGLAAKDAILETPDFAVLVEDQIKTWHHIWRLFDLTLETKEGTSKIQPSLLLHLNSLHVLGTASHNSVDLDTGIPARGWSEGYEGHIFWDDLFVFPFLNLRAPEITQSVLKYRYRRLNQARKIAKDMGFPGARYPWQSGSTGREETPKGGWDAKTKTWYPDYSHMQIHVNAAIAFNIWQYYQSTGNLDFMYVCGADMLLEIARFFAHFAKYNPERNRYEIHGVVGPDEFHVRYPDKSEAGINNNAYTNLMAVWTLSHALELLEILPEAQRKEVRERLNISDNELKLWDDVSRKMFIPLQENGIISEFEGYEKLKEFPQGKNGFIDLELLPQILQKEAGLPNEYQVSKQPDVLMLFYLFSSEELQELFDRLNYKFKPEYIPKNIEYYVKQTASGSSLSRVALAWVLSRGNRPKAWRHLHGMSASTNNNDSTETGIFPRSWDIFQEALVTDFLDIQGGATAEGLHMGAMAGAIDIVQRCYTGIVTKGDVLWLNPRLPEELELLSFHLNYRNQSVQFEISQKIAKVTTGASTSQPIKIGFKNKVYEFKPGTTKTFRIASSKLFR